MKSRFNWSKLLFCVCVNCKVLSYQLLLFADFALLRRIVFIVKMFKKLKQKIENTDGVSPQDGSSTTGGKSDDSRRFNRTTTFSSNLKKADSISSLNSCEDVVC